MKETISLDFAMFLVMGNVLQEAAIIKEMLYEEPDIKELVNNALDAVAEKYEIEN